MMPRLAGAARNWPKLSAFMRTVLAAATASAATTLLGAARLDTEDQALTGGVRITPKDLGTVSSGTVTPDPGDRPLQYYTNGGAHTLGELSQEGSCVVWVINNASAGAITTSAWDFVFGDAFTTTNGHRFRCLCEKIGTFSVLNVKALQ